jgi:pimeloyl-ACP methyl ester carboxylesterase
VGRNEGPTPEVVLGLNARFNELAGRHEGGLVLVGWSLGGIYAWALAAQFPRRVEQVITLGSPLRTSPYGLVRLLVPATSIWSRRDRIVPWSASVIEGRRTENIEVRSTHLTLGFDPLVTHAIADRLGQDPDDWQPFKPPWWLPGAYPDPEAT